MIKILFNFSKSHSLLNNIERKKIYCPVKFEYMKIENTSIIIFKLTDDYSFFWKTEGVEKFNNRSLVKWKRKQNRLCLRSL